MLSSKRSREHQEQLSQPASSQKRKIEEKDDGAMDIQAEEENTGEYEELQRLKRRLRDQLDRTNQAIANFNLQLSTPNLSEEEKTALDKRIAAAKEQQTELKAQMAELKQELKQLAAASSSSAVQTSQTPNIATASPFASPVPTAARPMLSPPRTPTSQLIVGDDSKDSNSPPEFAAADVQGGPGGAGEGLVNLVADGLFCARQATRQQLKQLAETKDGVLLVRGPYAAGKTSLVQLFLRENQEQKNQRVQVVSFLGLKDRLQEAGTYVNNPAYPALAGRSQWEIFWYMSTRRTGPKGYPWEELRPRRESSGCSRGWFSLADMIGSTQLDLVIFDETQMVYEVEEEARLWSTVKRMLQGQFPSKKLIMFASSGFHQSMALSNTQSPTAATIDENSSVGVERLFYTPAEGKEVFRLFREARGGVEAFPDRGAWEFLDAVVTNMTCLHPGAVADCLLVVQQRFFDWKTGKQEFNEDNLRKYILSYAFVRSLRNRISRAFPDLPPETLDRDDFHDDATHQQAQAMCLLLRKALVDLLFGGGDENRLKDSTLLVLEKKGYLVRDTDGTRRFACPLFRHLLRTKYSDQVCTDELTWLPRGVTFQERMNDALRKMDIDLVAQCLKKNEAQYVMVFTQALMPDLPACVFVSTEVTQFLGSETGRPDVILEDRTTNEFYALEFLHNGRRVTEHVNRFAKDGKYSGSDFKEWLVIDFLDSDRGTPKVFHDNLWRVRFSNDEPLNITMWKDAGAEMTTMSVAGGPRRLITTPSFGATGALQNVTEMKAGDATHSRNGSTESSTSVSDQVRSMGSSNTGVQRQAGTQHQAGAQKAATTANQKPIG